jgi:uncharacterized membrane protein
MLKNILASIVETLRSPGRQKFDPNPRWVGGRVKIEREAGDLYAFWRVPGNLPKMLRVLRAVTVREGGITDWSLRGHTGQALAFSCEQVLEEVGSRIEWRAVKEAPVESTLNVTFIPLERSSCELGLAWSVALKSDRGSEVPLSLDGLLDGMAQRMLDDDLDRLRSVLVPEVEHHEAEIPQRDEV